MDTFSALYATRLRTSRIPPRRRPHGECQTAGGRVCDVCHASHFGYEDEIRLKNEALRDFWSNRNLEGDLQPLRISPKGRWYRTVSKRKAFPARGGPVFGLIESRGTHGAKPLPVLRCAIEPEEHAEIYAACDDILHQPAMRPLADQVRYIVIKGNYREQTVILNVGEIDGRIRRLANTWSKRLTVRVPAVTAVFLYEDAGSDRYYLGSGNPGRSHAMQKVFGKPSVYLRIDAKSFLFHPLAFSQVNASAIETLTATVTELLPSDPQAVLYDLYSGYGLFSLVLADRWKRVIGAEISHEAVQSARENALRQHAGNVTFLRGPITGESIFRIMAGCSSQDCVILDPPRNGADPGVIDAIAARIPRRILHLFCNIDLLPDGLEQWRRHGYRVERAVPIDNFPGTNEVEVVVALVRADSQAP